MSIVEGGPNTAGIVARVQNILLKPVAEWDVIETEATTIPGLFTGYACILAAIGPIALIIGSLAFSHWALPLTIVIGVLTYISNLVGVFILGFIINALAPSFGATSNAVQAMKLAVYSYTAAWVAGVFNLLPMIAILAVLAGLYGLYLLYLGLPKLMKAPQDKTVGYFVVTLVVAVVVQMIIGAIIGAVTVMMAAGAIMGGAAALNHAAATPNGSSVAAATAQLAAAAKAMESGGADGKAVTAVDPQRLKVLLPESLVGLPRTEISAQGGGAGGVSASNAEAVYASDGGARITVSITDLAAAGALAGMASALNVNSSQETATGYQKVTTVGGRMTTEEWDNQSKSGKYGVLVANRFMVQADGTGASIEDLKAAVAAVGPDRLEGLARS